MTLEQYYLTILAEECAEVGQMCSKSIRFGLNETKRDLTITNAERLYEEYIDLITVVKILVDSGYIKEPTQERKEEMIKNKLEKIKKYLDYSKKLGIVHVEE